MAHLDLGQAEPGPAPFAPRRAEGEVGRTKYMLVITVIASTSIVVVAALFMSLF